MDHPILSGALPLSGAYSSPLAGLDMTSHLRSTVFLAVQCTVLASLCSGLARASDEADHETTTARYQLTYNEQRHPAFRSLAEGPNSLTSAQDSMFTFSLTAHWGARVWDGGELYFNPELMSGMPFTGNLVGLGGFTNGEITRAGGKDPKPYRQRLFLRQTWGRGGGAEQVEADFNQMAGTVDQNRTVLTVGNFSTLDVFDDNSYAKDPRTQFMNWSHWTYAAYDYAADARGFGWGAALEWYQDGWVFRAGRMTGPKDPNGLPVDYQLSKHYGDQLEIERRHEIGGQPGKARVLIYRNRQELASFRDATAYLQSHPGTDAQTIFKVRNGLKTKYGVGINIEQALDDDAGVFLRAMRSDGRTETVAFTEVDSSVSLGTLIKGRAWGRAEDTAGVAYAGNFLSRDRRGYLEAGGTSYFIGDGSRLSYKPESILEAFYSLRLTKGAWITADFQKIWNPAYNANRGPVNVYAARFHAEF